MYCAVGTDSEDCAVNITQGNCAWTNDGNCDDGSTGGNVICALGTDEPTAAVLPPMPPTPASGASVMPAICHDQNRSSD
jgi:hypothetical protein